MKCAVHSEVDATGYCRNCGKPMCAVCVRPVHDVLYCEDCLASTLGHTIPAAAAPAAAGTPYTAPVTSSPRAQKPGNPGIAFVLGLVPGLGAVYNGEYNKALIHVIIFATIVVGLSSGVGAGADVVLALSLAGFIFYMAFDAMRTTKAQRAGVPTSDPLNSWSKDRPLGPIILIVLGVLFLLNNFEWFPFWHLNRFWPVIFIIIGVLMFRNRLGRR